MSAETIKKLIWRSNLYLFGYKKVSKSDGIWMYGFLGFMFICLLYLIRCLIIY